MACAAPPVTSPDVTVLRWAQAFAAQDGDTVAKLTCRGGQADNQNSRLLSMAFGFNVPNYGAGGGQLYGGGGGGQPTYDVSQLEYETTFADDRTARVQVTGFLRIASGLAAQVVRMNNTVGLTRELGQWRVCGDALE
jgi:hypothetical protein